MMSDSKLQSNGAGLVAPGVIVSRDAIVGGAQPSADGTTARSEQGRTEAEVMQALMNKKAASDSAPQIDIPTSSEQSPTNDATSSVDTSSLNLTPEQLQQIIGATVDQVVADLRADNQKLQQQLQEVQQNRDSLEQVFRTIGKVAPNLNTRIAATRDQVAGLCKDFIQALDSAPTKVWVNPSSGERYTQRDLSRAKRLFFKHRDALRDEMEQFARRHGLLCGDAIYSSDAPTARADIPPAFLDYLSLVLRETHAGRYIFWQFPFYKLELGKGPGDTIQVARFRWLPEAATKADRTLTPGVNLNAGSQALVAAAVSIILGERGLGKDANFPPVAIPEFIMAYSMLDLENAVQTRLGHDYEAWEDLSIRTKYAATTRVVYNDNGGVTTVPANVDAGDDGTCTENFLNNLYAYMSGLLIPPLDDGCYVGALNDRALAQFKNSIGDKFRFVDGAAVEELTNLLQSASNRVMGKASGYVGKYCGFHLFSSNAFSMGAAGTEGVQSETLGPGATLTRASYFFGRAAVCRAIGMEAEVRRDNNDDFGRLNRFVWLSHETTGYLDVDPAINAEQQLRVVEFRGVDVPL
jgi:hypothetical protein